MEEIDLYEPFLLCDEDKKPPSQLAVKYMDDAGVMKVTGSDELKASQAYPSRSHGSYYAS